MSDTQINLEDRNDKLATHMPSVPSWKKMVSEKKKEKKRRKSRSIGEPQFGEAPERLE